MKKILIAVLLFASYNSFSQADAVTIVLHDSTLWLKNFTTNDSMKLNNRVPSIVGQSGKYLTNNGTVALWDTPAGGSTDTTSLSNRIDAKATGTGTASGTNTGDQTTVSGNAGTATALQTAVNIDGVPFDGSVDIVTENNELVYQALGSSILAQTVNQRLDYCNASVALVDGQIKYEAIYLPKAATLTGLKFYSRVAGNYTGDNNNRIGLYSFNTSTGLLTLVASSANNATLWTGVAAASVYSIAFSSTYAAAAGVYYAAYLYNNSAQTTAPAIASAISLNNIAMSGTAYGFANSAKLYGTSTGTDLPATIASSAITASLIVQWVAIY